MPFSLEASTESLDYPRLINERCSSALQAGQSGKLAEALNHLPKFLRASYTRPSAAPPASIERKHHQTPCHNSSGGFHMVPYTSRALSESGKPHWSSLKKTNEPRAQAHKGFPQLTQSFNTRLPSLANLQPNGYCGLFHSLSNLGAHPSRGCLKLARV